MAFVSPLRYPGGKTKVYDNLISLFKENAIETPIYIEPYAGGAGLALKLLFNKKVEKIILNDYDRSIYAIWYSILNYTEEFCQLIESTPVSLEEREKQKEMQLIKADLDILSLGFSTFYLNRVNRSGIINGGPIGGKSQSSKYKIDCRFNKKDLINKVRKIGLLKNQIELFNLDALDFINKINMKKSSNLFVFFDPPYYCKGPGLYENHYEHDDHLEISKNIKKICKYPWILTYDNVEEIKKMYKKLEMQEFDITYTAANKVKAKEIIIYSDLIKNKIFIKKRKS